MGTLIKSGYVGQPHAHLTGRPSLLGKPAQVPAKGKVYAQLPPINGAPLWAELHRRALSWQGMPDTQWLTNFRLRVPCGDCRKHWDRMLAATPPDWGNYFAWTVARHNEVNTRLKKPEITEVEARERWSAGPAL